MTTLHNTLGFTSKSKVFPLYKALKPDEKKLQNLDQGYLALNPHLKTFETVGKNDGRISKAEVYDKALNQWQRFQTNIQALDLTIPWELSDHDPATSFDEALLTKIRSELKSLKMIFEKTISKSDPEYQKKWAFVVYVFSVATENQPGKTIYLGESEKNLLAEWGLNSIQDYLQAQGGLGLYFLHAGSMITPTALNTLYQAKDHPLGVAFVLYSIFNEAELDPQFIFLNSSDEQGNVRNEHIAVGLKWGEKWQIYDPVNCTYDGAKSFIYKRDFPNQQVINERIALSMFYNSQALIQFSLKKYPQALESINKSEELNPTDYTSSAKGIFLQALYRETEAIEMFTKALKQNPGNISALLSMGYHHVRKGDLLAAAPFFMDVIKISPKTEEAYQILTDIFISKGQEFIKRNAFPNALHSYQSASQVIEKANANNIFIEINKTIDVQKQIEELKKMMPEPPMDKVI